MTVHCRVIVARVWAYDDALIIFSSELCSGCLFLFRYRIPALCIHTIPVRYIRNLAQPNVFLGKPHIPLSWLYVGWWQDKAAVVSVNPNDMRVNTYMSHALVIATSQQAFVWLSSLDLIFPLHRPHHVHQLLGVDFGPPSAQRDWCHHVVALTQVLRSLSPLLSVNDRT